MVCSAGLEGPGGLWGRSGGPPWSVVRVWRARWSVARVWKAPRVLRGDWKRGHAAAAATMSSSGAEVDFGGSFP